VADCVCDLYGGCCDDARQREYARTFGPSVSTASANGVDYRPHLGRVGADGPDPRSFAEQLTNTGGGIR